MENTNYDHGSSQPKGWGFNNTLLLVFIPICSEVLTGNTGPEEKQDSHYSGNMHHPFGASSRQTKAGRKKASFGNPQRFIFLLCLPALLWLVCYVAQIVKPSAHQMFCKISQNTWLSAERGLKHIGTMML